MDKSGIVFLLLLLIVVTWMFVTGRINGAIDALAGKKAVMR